MFKSSFKKATCLALFLALCSPLSLAAETLKIGVMGSHTGDLASYGLPTLSAVRLVVQDINKNGGLLGKQVEVLAQDTQCKPELATNAATKLVSDGAVAVIGGICSGSTKSALPIYTESKIVSISPSATTPDLTNGENPYFFRTIASDNEQGLLAASFLADSLKAKRVAVLHDRADYGKGFADSAMAALKEKGVEVVLYEGITAGAIDYGAVINKVRQTKADAVLYGGYHPEASKLVQQMKKRRMDLPFISDDGVRDDTFIQVAGPDSEGVYATGPRDVSSLPANIQARSKHTKAHGKAPGAFYDNAYAATVALLAAIEKGNSTKPEDIVNNLQENLVETPLGPIKFAKNGEAEGIGFSVFQVQNGKYVPVTK